jgi:hypothetical protein
MQMNIVQRAINILTNPKSEWPRIDAEPATKGGLLTGYALPLALLPFVGTVIGALLLSGAMGPFAGAGIVFIIVSALVGVVIGLAILFVMSLIADALAPNFGGVRSPVGAMKLLVYSGTATWVAGFFSFVPVVGWLIALLGFGYAAYLLYLGSQAVMKVPQGSAAGYTAVVIIIWIVLSFVAAFLIGAIMAMVFLSTAVSGAGYMYR